jgi:type IV secretion system protein VirB1
VLAIIHTESGGNPFALNVNGARQPARQTNAGEAAATARRYVAAGYSVDLGLGQINSRNMRWLGLTWDTVFDPCTNVAALARVLTTNYSAVKAGRDPQTALRIALSMYNTGSQTRGFRNGYPCCTNHVSDCQPPSQPPRLKNHTGLVTVLRRSLISLCHLCFERQRANSAQI